MPNLMVPPQHHHFRLLVAVGGCRLVPHIIRQKAVVQIGRHRSVGGLPVDGVLQALTYFARTSL